MTYLQCLSCQVSLICQILPPIVVYMANYEPSEGVMLLPYWRRLVDLCMRLCILCWSADTFVSECDCGFCQAVPSWPLSLRHQAHSSPLLSTTMEQQPPTATSVDLPLSNATPVSSVGKCLSSVSPRHPRMRQVQTQPSVPTAALCPAPAATITICAFP